MTRRGSVPGKASGMLKSGEGALLKLKPAIFVPKGCWVGVGDAVVDVDDVDDVVALSGESDPASSVWPRMGDCENAVRSFWRERAGERRRDGMVCVYVGCCVVGLIEGVMCLLYSVEYADML
jgi:hypothetical protein